MREYKKPMIQAERFVANQTVAGCDRVVTGTETTTTYDKLEVYCIIGNQKETVFNTSTSCSTTATQWGVTEYENKLYFVWYTYEGDVGSGGAPDGTTVDTLDALVEKLDFTTGSGWHFADVSDAKHETITNILGFSY